MQKIRAGLSASQIKWVALIFMTIDHLDVFFSNISFLSRWTTILRLLGRIAAPLFLYLLTESIRYTRSKKNFIFRLYIAGVATGLFTIFTNLLFGSFLVYTPGNILFTFLYTAILVIILDRTRMYIRNQNLIGVGLVLLPCIILIILLQLCNNYFANIRLFPNNVQQEILFREVLSTFLPPILSIEYSIMFPMMGIALYFAKKKSRQCLVFIFFCFLSFAGAFTGWDLWPINSFTAPGQYWMILALPFMILYNHKRGKAHKLFFYIYYPVHRYLLTIIGKYLSL